MKITLTCDSITQNKNQYNARLILPVGNNPQTTASGQQQINVKAAINIVLPMDDTSNHVFQVNKSYDVEINEVIEAGFPKKK